VTQTLLIKQIVNREVNRRLKEIFKPQVDMFKLPGGRLPMRMTDGAIGYDAYIRAVVCAHNMDSRKNGLRKMIFDFQNMPREREIRNHVYRARVGDKKTPQLVYRMEPHESVLVGIGFITAMPFPLFYWVTPRSGLASRQGITVTNAPGTVDPDYRGEAGVLVYNRTNKPFDLYRGLRIAQSLFQLAIIPKIRIVKRLDDLPISKRNSGGFGSTGLS
jgi:dUTP pyrophosphatase